MIGVITDARWFIAGIVVVIVVIAEWMILAWSERASADRAYNAEVRDRVLHPLELPIAGAVVLVVIIFGFSRMMLALPRDAGPVLFVVAAGLIAAFGCDPRQTVERAQRAWWRASARWGSSPCSPAASPVP